MTLVLLREQARDDDIYTTLSQIAGERDIDEASTHLPSAPRSVMAGWRARSDWWCESVRDAKVVWCNEVAL